MHIFKIFLCPSSIFKENLGWLPRQLGSSTLAQKIVHYRLGPSIFEWTVHFSQLGPFTSDLTLFTDGFRKTYALRKWARIIYDWTRIADFRNHLKIKICVFWYDISFWWKLMGFGFVNLFILNIHSNDVHKMPFWL